MKKIIIYTDGGSRGNPGPGGIGVVFCNQKDQIIKKYSKHIGDKVTNNEAEYEAVIFALQKFKALFGKQLAKSTDVEIKSDSELITKQLKGEYKIIDENLGKLFLKVWNLKFDFKSVKFKYISREKNKEADTLANEALDLKASEQGLKL